MKQLFACCLFLFGALSVSAQDEGEDAIEPSKGFNPNKMFVGTALALGFTSGSFSIGANPEIGYSLTKWLDAGLGFNLNYYSISAEYNFGVQQNSFNYGGGPFLRIYPLPFLFVQGQYEYNWVNYTLKDQVNGGSEEFTNSSSSMLIGIGYGSRFVGQSNFYTALLFDVGGDKYSPYTDNYGSAYPFFRAGFNFYLGRKR